MHFVCNALWELPEAQELLSRIKNRVLPVAVGGLSAVHKAHLMAAVRRKTGRPVAMICPDEAEAARVAQDCATLAQEEALCLKSRAFSFYPVEAVSREWEHARLPVLYRAAANTAPIITGTPDAFMQRTLSPDALLSCALRLREGQALEMDALCDALIRGGYRRCDLAEGIGQFSVRGGIADIFSPGGAPVRVEFFGDEIDTVNTFDPATQLRVERIQEALVLPVAETLAHTAPGGVKGLADALAGIGHAENQERLLQSGHLPDIDKYTALVAPEMTTALDFLPAKTIVFLSEQTLLRERIKNTLWQAGQDIERLLEQKAVPAELTEFVLDDLAFFATLEEFECVQLDLFLPNSYALRPRAIMNITTKQLPSFGASLETAAGDIAHYKEGGFATAVMVPDSRRQKHLEELLRDKGLPAVLGSTADMPPGGVSILSGALSAGMEYPALKLAVLTEGQQSPTIRKRARPVTRRDATKKRLVSYTDLSAGDLVVHEHHGIGRFAGIVTMPVDSVKRDYIKIVYSGDDVIYVPVTQLNLVSKYIGAGEGSSVRLHKLGGAEWTKARTRAKAAAKNLAAGLIKLQAERKRRRGFAFPPDDDLQSGFEASFEYEETDDQLRCAGEIKGDMETALPMDRLLCGDVGFGKTEVALRAVMKCVLGGKQAAILVPTTILAQQHYQTASRRFAGTPVRVDMLSRFRTPAQCTATLKKMALGHTDLIVGTHKLLQKNIKFKNLGLLVVDEEQRFGVTHKERLKELSRQVDVLTLTATPIPRTLNMALSGVRDLSTIEEAPRDRYPVQTFVLEHDWSLLFDALRRETARGGQAYYLHNRVETIDQTASRIASALPDVAVATAHGQMKEDELADVMQRVVDGEVQILVCTTIIETGLDIPNVNTLIIEDADRMGLAQLHQIRGRVGRSNRHAFAYLTYRRGKILQEAAAKRLAAVREFAEFGSGLKIAMRDLEIRGAGNVLGAEQHGHMMSVGYEMYLRLLEEAVLEEQGGDEKPPVQCVADLPISASIPERYIAHAGIRMDFYRRIAALEDEGEQSDLIDEMADRFGDVPAGVHTLTRVALLRAAAARAGVTELQQKSGRLVVKIAEPDFARVAILCAQPRYKGKILFSAGNEPHLSLRLVSGEDIIDVAGGLVKEYTELLRN